MKPINKARILFIISLGFILFWFYELQYCKISIDYGAFFLLLGMISFYIFFYSFVYLCICFHDSHKIKNTRCEHGVRGGETLNLCKQCNDIKRTRDQLIRIGEASEKFNREEMGKYSIFLKNQLGYFQNLNPYKFEDQIAEMYRKYGYKATQTPYSNDMGKDIILEKKGEKYLVECKRYNKANTIGRPPLQKFYAAIIEEQAICGFFITTSDFNNNAISYAIDKNIRLINGKELLSLMQGVYPNPSKHGQIMCKQCGNVIEFRYWQDVHQKNCSNGHIVINPFRDI